MGIVLENVTQVHVYAGAQMIPHTQSTNTLWHHIVQPELRTFYNPLNAAGQPSLSGLCLKNGIVLLFYQTLL